MFANPHTHLKTLRLGPSASQLGYEHELSNMLQRVDLLLKEKEASNASKPVATPARAATAMPAIVDAEAKTKTHQFGTGGATAVAVAAAPRTKPSASRAPEPTAAVAPKSKPNASKAPEPADVPAEAEIVINTTTHKKQYMQMATCLST